MKTEEEDRTVELTFALPTSMRNVIERFAKRNGLQIERAIRLLLICGIRHNGQHGDVTFR